MGALAGASSPRVLSAAKGQLNDLVEKGREFDQDNELVATHRDDHDGSGLIKLRITKHDDRETQFRGPQQQHRHHHYHCSPLMDVNGRLLRGQGEGGSMKIVKSAGAATNATKKKKIGPIQIDGPLNRVSSRPITCQQRRQGQPKLRSRMRTETRACCQLHGWPPRRLPLLTSKLDQGNSSLKTATKPALLYLILLVHLLLLYPANHHYSAPHHADQPALRTAARFANENCDPLVQSQRATLGLALARQITSGNTRVYQRVASQIHANRKSEANLNLRFNSDSHANLMRVDGAPSNFAGSYSASLSDKAKHLGLTNEASSASSSPSEQLAIATNRSPRTRKDSAAATREDSEIGGGNNDSGAPLTNQSVAFPANEAQDDGGGANQFPQITSTSDYNESETKHSRSNDKRVSRILEEFKQKYLLNRALSNRAYYLILVIYVIFSIFGALSNSIICLTVILKPKILSPRNIFILNLASSDLLLCIFTMPFSFIEISTKTWPMGELPCKLVSSLQATSIFVSTISITAIALDRYRVIVYSTHQEMGRMSGLTGACIVISVWFAALILALPLFLTRQLSAQYMRDDVYQLLGIKKELYYFCYEEWPFDHGRGIYSVVSMFIQYVIPITIVSIVYVKISGKLQKRLITRQRLTQLENQHKRQLQLINRTHNMLITVSLVFGLCWLPLNLLNVIVDFTQFLTKDENTFRTIFAICHLIGCFSACSNPVLYGYMNENFRKEIVQVYSQQWQKILRYLCRFKTHSRSTKRTAATTTTTTSPTSSESSSSCPSITSATSSDTDDTDDTSSSVNLSCSSSLSQLSYSKLKTGQKFSKLPERPGSVSESMGSSSRRCSKSSCNIRTDFVRPSSAIDRDPELQPRGDRKLSSSPTAIDMALSDPEGNRNESRSEVNSITRNGHKSNHELGGQIRRSSMSTKCMKNVDAASINRVELIDQDCGRHRSGNELQLTNHHQHATNWLGRVLVRGVWFMGSMSSCGDKTGKDEHDLTSSSHTGARHSCANTSKASDKALRDHESRMQSSQHGSDNQSSRERDRNANNHIDNVNHKCRNHVTMDGNQTKCSRSKDNKTKHGSSKGNGNGNINDKTNNKSKTKCLCHCHNGQATRSSARNAMGMQGADANSNEMIDDYEGILRTRSTGVRPQIADALTAEARLAANMGVSMSTNNNDSSINKVHDGGSFDQNLERRSSSAEVTKANRNNNNNTNNDNVYKLKTISAVGTATKRGGLNQADPTSALGQRVWLRFFPSMQKYCFNQAAQPNVIANEQRSRNNNKGRSEIKSPKHCAICSPSAERRRKERRDQRRLRKLARKEARSHRVNKTTKNCEKSNQGHKKRILSINKGDSPSEPVVAATSACQPDKCKHNKQAVGSIESNAKSSCASAPLHHDRQATGGRKNLDDGPTTCDNSETMISCHSGSVEESSKAHRDCNEAPCLLAQCSGPNNCTIDSVNESEVTRKESSASYGSKSWGAMTPSSSYSCNQLTVSYSTCSCLNHSSFHCNGSMGCVESLSSAGERQALHEAEREPNL